MSLTSVAAPIWNEIAKTEELKTEWAKKAFAMTGEEMANLVSREYQELKTKGLSFPVIYGFLTVKPLLLENVAISRHIQRTGYQGLRSALPEITSIDEAAMIASEDTPMTLEEQEQLAELLRAELPSKNE